jgi:hypothetical protein
VRIKWYSFARKLIVQNKITHIFNLKPLQPEEKQALIYNEICGYLYLLFSYTRFTFRSKFNGSLAGQEDPETVPRL